MKVASNSVICQHGTIVVFPSGDVAQDKDCNCLPSEFERAYNKSGNGKVKDSIKSFDLIHTEITIAELAKILPKDPKGQTSMIAEDLKTKCIEWFNTEKKAVSALTYDECTARAHEYESAILELQEKVKAVRSKQVDIITEETDETKRQEYLRYKPCPASVKEEVAKLSPEQKKTNKLEKEIDNAMQSLSLDRELAMMFLRKTKPNLFN